jgi:hypothetical protein
MTDNFYHPLLFLPTHKKNFLYVISVRPEKTPLHSRYNTKIRLHELVLYMKQKRMRLVFRSWGVPRRHPPHEGRVKKYSVRRSGPQGRVKFIFFSGRMPGGSARNTALLSLLLSLQAKESREQIKKRRFFSLDANDWS